MHEKFGAFEVGDQVRLHSDSQDFADIAGSYGNIYHIQDGMAWIELENGDVARVSKPADICDARVIFTLDHSITVGAPVMAGDRLAVALSIRADYDGLERVLCGYPNGTLMDMDAKFVKPIYKG